jgi:hypothetical protein
MKEKMKGRKLKKEEADEGQNKNITKKGQITKKKDMKERNYR